MGPSIAIVDVQRILARSVVGQLARELVQEYQDAETRQEREQDLLSFVLQGVAKIVQELGAELGVSVIVERQRAGILYAASDADLTTRVLQIYDERYAKIDSAAARQLIRGGLEAIAAARQAGQPPPPGQYL
jgi:Skp family chaperone for outer membrane proteins